jgi:hypothetical protein
MTHLTNEELVAWRDRDAGVDRDRILAHLAGCRDCTESYAALVRTAPANEAPIHFKAEDFVERGYAVRREARQPGWSAALTSWKVWSGVVTAAAAVVLVVTLGGGTWPGGANPVRGDRLELTSPVAAAGQPITLEWSTGLRATKYAVVVTTPVGGEVFRTTTDRTSIPLPRTVTARLLPGTPYSWKVTALDGEDQPITSATGTLVVAKATR